LAVGNVDALAVRSHCDAVREIAGLDALQHRVLGDIDHIDGAVELARDVGLAAVGQKTDAAWAAPHRYVRHLFALSKIDDIDLSRLLCAREDPLAVGAEHGMLGILAFDFDVRDAFLGRRVDERDRITDLNRRRGEASVRGHAYTLWRFAQIDLVDYPLLV